MITLDNGKRVVVQRYRRRGTLSTDVLPGVPVPEVGEVGPGGPRFPQMARVMGELLAVFRRLPAAGLELDRLWADPERLTASAAGWARQLSITTADPCLDAVPGLFAGRPVVLAHGDFAPVNVLTDGEKVTGLLDFEAVRLADPLFDAAWWAWSVSFSSLEVLQEGWPAFLEGAGIDAAEPGLADRVRALQVLRMLEQLAAGNLTPGIASA
jgi:aminoglycoside phosphotransferase (APT) family kinase protein